jgi:Na+/H+ antiporter NhaD/arsenite permease-like protein
MRIEEVVFSVVGAGLLALVFIKLRLGWIVSVVIAGGGAACYLLLRGTIMGLPQAFTTTVFLVAYALIASEQIHKTTVALCGAMVMLLAGLVTQEEAFHGHGAIAGVDWNTIFLLIGMMIIVHIMQGTGVFEWVAIKAAKLARGEPVAIMILLSLVTAALSAALDNVTTVLMIAPVALLICRGLQINPVPMLMFVILSSNIGGTATLIGDPPNIMIGSAARLTFADFLRVNLPIVLVILAVYAVTVKLVMGRRVRVTAEQRQRVMAFAESEAITDWRLLRRSLSVLGLTLLGFGLHGWLGLEMATIAMAGAALMLLMHHEGPENACREVEWGTIFFFIGLFIMVSAVVKVGVVDMLGAAILGLTGHSVLAMTMLVLWLSAFASALVGNVPFTATMTALIHSVAATLHPEAGPVAAAHAPEVYPLWWAVSLGACLGGNLTPVGAAANLVVTGLAARSGDSIGFARFMKYGVPIALQGLVLSSLWLWLLFLR